MRNHTLAVVKNEPEESCLILLNSVWWGEGSQLRKENSGFNFPPILRPSILKSYPLPFPVAFQKRSNFAPLPLLMELLHNSLSLPL